MDVKGAIWTRHFAWHPVLTGSGWRWLRWLECRHTGPLGPDSVSSYPPDRLGYWTYRDRRD